MWFLYLLFTAILGYFTFKFLFSKNPQKIFNDNGIPFIDTSPALSKLDLLLSRKSLSAADNYAYTRMSLGYCGISELGSPLVLIKDPNLIKKLLIKDFDHFVDRRHAQTFSEQDGPFKKMLPSLQGEEWKGIRASVSPTFTTAKIRKMMSYFNNVAKEWVEEYRKNKEGITIQVISAINQYTVEVISNTVFGMSAGVIQNPESEFAQKANKLANFSKVQLAKLLIRMNLPKIGNFLRLSIIDKNCLNYFESILEQGLKQRLDGSVKRQDFLQLLVEAHKGELKMQETNLDDLEEFERDAQISTKKVLLTQNIMTAQAVVFFMAGFSTTSNFITFTLYTLALYPEIQNKLRQEVSKIVKKDGSFDYDEVATLVYLDMVTCEILRKFAPTGRLERMCVKDYYDPESGLKIPKGTLIGVPLRCIHNDKEHYENPEDFDPEHFKPEKKTERSAYAYMPFGIGPRNCIGMRFAQIEGKSAVAHIVHNFLIEPTQNTPRPLQGKPAGMNVVPPDNLELKLIPI